MKIGELAKSLGITTRTLRWYETEGLLEPAWVNEAGHRCYNDASLARLQQIMSLKSLGFSLREIRQLIDRDGLSLKDVIDRHLKAVMDEIRHKQQLYQRLSDLSRMLASNETISHEDYLETLKVTIMFEQYYSNEQREQLKQCAEALGPEQIEAAQQRWPQLITEVRDAMDKGLAPDSKKVSALATEWRSLTEAFTGGDAGVSKSLGKAWSENPDAMSHMGLDADVFAFIGKAMKTQ